MLHHVIAFENERFSEKLFFQLCANWHHFYDPESGIDFYLVSVGSEPITNMTDVANLTLYDRKTHEVCVQLEPENYLEHGLTYFTTVWAYNGGVNQRYINSISNGGMYYTLNWVQRLLCMVSCFW